MNEPNQDIINVEITEIERLIHEFKEKFVASTANAEDFLTISQLELLWGELQSRTNNIYSDMIRKLMSEVDESDLISKKKILQTQRCDAQNTCEERHYCCDHLRKTVFFEVFPNSPKYRKQGASAPSNGRKEHSSHGFLSWPVWATL
jgi:hypothetical protein